jgi:hypothetical protein
VVPLFTESEDPVSGENEPARLSVSSFRARDFNMGPHPNAHLEVILHNRGGTRAVVDEAIVKVDRVFAVKRCASQDDIPLSETYGLVLPHHAQSTSHVVPLHDQVGPDEIDRFALSVSTHLSNRDPATYYLFRLSLELGNDSPRSPLPIGNALIALPIVPDQGEYFWTPTTVGLLRNFQTEGQTVREFWGQSMPCWRRNTKVLKKAFKAPAVQSAKLAAISRELIFPSFAKLE